MEKFLKQQGVKDMVSVTCKTLLTAAALRRKNRFVIMYIIFTFIVD